MVASAHDFEFGALARYLDAHPVQHAVLMRHDGKWVIRVMSAIGIGASLGEAAANVCNALFANGPEVDPFSHEAFSRDTAIRALRAELPTIPEKG